MVSLRSVLSKIDRTHSFEIRYSLFEIRYSLFTVTFPIKLAALATSGWAETRNLQFLTPCCRIKASKGLEPRIVTMKILHVLSNWKWTERSEPAVDLAVAQTKLGTEVQFACGRAPAGSAFNAASHARQKGLTTVHELNLPKHFHISAVLRDRFRLRRILEQFGPDIVHCHMRNAHLTIGLGLGGMARRPLIVRSCYNPAGPAQDLRSRWLYRFRTDGLVVIGRQSREYATTHCGFPPEDVQIAEPGIDLQRFAPQREIACGRSFFGLRPTAFVVGVVSRIRPSRRIDIALEALRKLLERFPQVQLLVVGRGSPGVVEEIVEKPVRRLGIADHVRLPGYCRDDELVGAYRSMDVLVYPTPGTDPTCRTVREAMAAGVPVIAPSIGFLPALIEDRVTGRLMELSSDSLAAVLAELICDPDRVRRMARRSLETAEKRFSAERQAETVLDFYRRLSVSESWIVTSVRKNRID
jgi:glycosyltransferase involved in cell wall biosynthesis